VPSEHEASAAASPVDRREDRNPTNWIAKIRLPDGTEIPCNVKDVSKSGAKVGIPSYHVLPETFMLRIIGRDFVCLVRLAWRRGDYAGVRIERVGKVAPPKPAHELAPQREAAPASTPAVQPDAESASIGVRSRKRVFSSY
jgi:hypothetical protein